MDCHNCYKLFSLQTVPSAPLNTAVTNTTSTSVLVSWSPPLYPNGITLAYKISLVGVESFNPVPNTFYNSTKHTVMVNSSDENTDLELTDLVPYSLYNITITAMNRAGYGEPSEPISVRTREDGECVYYVQIMFTLRRIFILAVCNIVVYPLHVKSTVVTM